MLRGFLEWLRDARCIHKKSRNVWRPCLAEGRPARVCSLCDKVEEMTVEEFYAWFGRMPQML
jgi:hypothetical protein